MGCLILAQHGKTDRGLWITSGLWKKECCHGDLWLHPCSDATNLNCLRCFWGHLYYAFLIYVLSFWRVQLECMKSVWNVFTAKHISDKFKHKHILPLWERDFFPFLLGFLITQNALKSTADSVRVYVGCCKYFLSVGVVVWLLIL